MFFTYFIWTNYQIWFCFAFPFFFLALFPQYLAKLPKSGGWLNSVKVVMGFLEMAAAFKFLSNTDLVWGWGFFSHNAVLAVWAVLMLLTGFYILGKIQLPHDSPLKSISVPRLMLSTAFLTFGLYLTSGLFGQRIHGLIYSYLPPKIEGATGAIISSGQSMSDELTWYRSLDDGLAEARATGKSVFIDFTGYTCTNCRWMEANVFVKKDVHDRFKEMVLVQLYTDGGPNHRENQEYQKNRTSDEDRTRLLELYLNGIKKYVKSNIDGFKEITELLETIIDELEYESMRKYEIQNRLEREGKHDKLFRKFMNSYLTTIVLDNKMEIKK